MQPFTPHHFLIATSLSIYFNTISKLALSYNDGELSYMLGFFLRYINMTLEAAISDTFVDYNSKMR